MKQGNSDIFDKENPRHCKMLQSMGNKISRNALSVPLKLLSDM